jgi:hypothetical protein
MGKQMTKLKLVLMAILLMFSVMVVNQGTFTGVTVAQAATKKASISTTKMTIPIGKLKSGIYWTDIKTWDRGVAQKLTVKNSVKGASYSFTSSDKKVATIGKDGGYLTGVSAGTATITCKQTYQKKTTVVGTCKVTVKKANFKAYNDLGSDGDLGNSIVAVGSGEYDFYSAFAGMDAFFYIGYRNPSAKYTFKSDSADFTMEEVKYSGGETAEFAGVDYSYGYKYTAKKAGIYTITVQETYNKKTTKLGSFKVEAKDTYVETDEIQLRLGDSTRVIDYVYYTTADTAYYFSVDNYDEAKPESNVVGLGYNDYDTEKSNLLLVGQVPGTATVTVRKGSVTGDVIGTLKIKVYEAACEEIVLESNELTTYVGDEYFSIYFDLEPYDTTDKVTIESDKPEILKVKYSEDEGWVYSPLKAGTANVTIKCGSKTAVVKVIVTEEETW